MLLSMLPKTSYDRVLDIGCGNGFITRALPGKEIVGLDVSANAIAHAEERSPAHIRYHRRSLFELPLSSWEEPFDLIVITGVLYPQYIADSELLVYTVIDGLLRTGGHLVCCHIKEWYRARFPYTMFRQEVYPYREYVHVLEGYVKL